MQPTSSSQAVPFVLKFIAKMHIKLLAIRKKHRKQPTITSQAAPFVLKFVSKMYLRLLAIRKKHPERPLIDGPVFDHSLKFYRFQITADDLVTSTNNILNSKGPPCDARHKEVIEIARKLARDHEEFEEILERWELEVKGERKDITAYRIAFLGHKPNKQLPTIKSAIKHVQSIYPLAGRFDRIWLARMRRFKFIEPVARLPETEEAKQAREAKELLAKREKAKQSPAYKWLDKFMATIPDKTKETDQEDVWSEDEGCFSEDEDGEFWNQQVLSANRKDTIEIVSENKRKAPAAKKSYKIPKIKK